ncbi:hypothetical protein FUAX_02360 [Fulvitalea axinellae]|uniref:RDD domain-containing protein n=1 Tax=Fulvitalea axinellae TaxID=1182444 RepID=A0AAU9D072_9BACT|nr:hypothetical protein FUAX_02360 [Fulvitalea axinellae]
MGLLGKFFDVAERHIKPISITVAGFCAVFCLVPFLPRNFIWDYREGIYLLKLLSPYVNLEGFGMKFFIYKDFEDVFGHNTLEIAFCILAVLGVVLFLKTDRKETRLLRFMYSIIFTVKAFALLGSLVIEIKTGFSNISLLTVLVIIAYAVWILVAFAGLKAITKSESPAKEVAQSAKVSRWQRLFHHIVDFFLSYLLFSYLIFNIWGDFFRDVASSSFGEPTALTLLAFACRFLYGVFCEAFLSATPAMILAGATIQDKNGNRPDFITIVGRTIFRFTPLEPVIYLLTGYLPHDKWTETAVVKVKGAGVRSRKYLLLFPLLIVFIGGPVLSLKAYNDYKSEQRWEREQMAEDKLLWHNFEKLDKNSVLVFNLVSGYDGYKYVKVEGVDGDNLELTPITYDGYSEPSGRKLAEIYNQMVEEGLYNLIPASKKALRKCVVKYGKNVPGQRVLMDEKMYRIKNIIRINEPKIELAGSVSRSTSGEVNIGIESTGQDCTLTKIELLEGKLDISTETPLALLAGEYSSYGFDLDLKNYTLGSDFKIRLTVETDKGEKYSFLLIGEDSRHTISPEF